MRIGLGIVGFLMLIWAAWGKSFRWGLYAFVKDESDIVLDRQTGRMVAAVIRYCLHDRSDPVQRAGLIGAVGLWSMSDMADFSPRMLAPRLWNDEIFLVLLTNNAVRRYTK